MRLRQIEIFYHVYKSGSVSGAARDLNVSQPSVSKVLRYAEDQLGFDLFKREKGRLSPTPAAHELFDEIKDIYQRISSFNRTAGNIKSRKGGHIRLGVLPSLGLSVVPEAISNLRKTNEDLSFGLITLHSDELLEAILEKRCDLCVGFEYPIDERLAVDTLGQSKLVMVSKDKLSKDTGSPDFDLLQGADFIGMKESGPLASILADAFDVHQINPNEVVSAHTYYIALSLVRKGLGIAVTDYFTAYSPFGSDLHRYFLENIKFHPVCSFYLADHQQAGLINQCSLELKRVITDLLPND